MRVPENWRNLEIIDEIGSGSYGTVYEVEDVDTGKAYALKVINLPKDKEEEEYIQKNYGDAAKDYFENLAKEFDKEISMMKSLVRNENIVAVKDYTTAPNESGIGWKVYILMELLDELNSVNFAEEDVIQLGLNLCNALEECEKQHIVHRDIKPANVLISENNVFKLGDFGMAKRIDKTESHSVKGTFTFMAPELYYGNKYDNQVDIYSLGLVMYHLLNKNREPFLDIEKGIVYFADREQALMRRMSGETLPDPVDASPELAEIIRKACAFSIDKRYRSASQMKKDLWSLKLGTYKLKVGRKKKKEISHDKKSTIKKKVLASTVVLAALCLMGVGGKYFIGNMWYTNVGTASRINHNGLLITDGSETIDQIAFSDPSVRNRVKQVEFSETVTEIKDEMFKGCPLLRKVELPEGTLSIGKNAFMDCTSLETVFMPDTVETLGAGVFENCGNLKEIYISSDVSELPENAFRGCSELEVLSGGDSITSINNNVFYDCTSLREYPKSDMVESVGKAAFHGCEKLKEIYLAEGMESISSYCFYNCKSLESIILPESLHLISDHAFQGCVSLQEVYIPDEMWQLDSAAFADCSGMKKVSVNSRTVFSEPECFSNCPDLTIEIRE